MKEALYIDGKDAYTSYGVSISDIAYDDLVCLPTLKPIAFNDWHEKNGIEPDLTSPVIAAKKISIPMYLSGQYQDYAALLNALSGGAYHTFNFASIGLKKDLRLVDCGDIRTIDGLSSFTLTFSDDEPLKDYTYIIPSSRWEQLGDYLIDDIDIAVYGIRVIRGTMDSIKKSPAVKENLKRDISIQKGLYYDSSNVVYKSRTAELKCLMRASDSNEFWRNRNALLYDLTKPGERKLSVTELDKVIPFFYKDCKVNCFFPDKGKFWFEFTLSIEFFKGVI